MTDNVASSAQIASAGTAAAPRRSSIANGTLKTAVKSCFTVLAVGQWLFALYVAAFYGGPAITGKLEKWNTFLPNGYIAGDTSGNILLALHLFLAVAITVAGPLQVIPQIRARAPSFHRWNGRIYLATAFIISIAAIYLKFIRPIHEHMYIAVGFTINGVLIVIFAAVAWRHALVRDFGSHQRWALRTFIMVSGTWIYRIGFVVWFMINQGPVGHTDDFHGPFDAYWGLTYSLLSLAVLEAYFYTKDRAGPRGRLAMSAVLFVLTALMGLATLIATLFFWLPNVTGIKLIEIPMHM